MAYKTLEEMINVIDAVSSILNISRISDESVRSKWQEYPNEGCCFISFDIHNNDLRDFKCYVRQDSVNNSNQYDEREMSSYFEWGEYSFSLLQRTLNNTNIRKIIHRIKPMPIEQAKEYVYNLFSSANAIKYLDEYLQLADTITEITKTKRYPILGGGFAIDKSTDEIEEIKLYYQLLRFNNYFDEFGDNSENIKEKSAEKLINILCDKKMKKVYSPIFDEFSKQGVPLSLFAINKNIYKNTQINKFYFREGSRKIIDPVKLINNIHKILFSNNLSANYSKAIEKILCLGFNQGEFCVATDGINSILKIYYYA